MMIEAKTRYKHLGNTKIDNPINIIRIEITKQKIYDKTKI